MFGSSRQLSRKTLSRCQFLKPCYKLSACSESLRCLTTWKHCSEHVGVNKKVGNRGQKRWSSSYLSEGLSHHYHPGPPLVEITVGQLLSSAVEKWPNRECIVSAHQGIRLTYSDVLERADKIAAGLIKLGLKRGDRVGLWGPNDIEWFISFMAITRAGFIMVGINPAYQQSEIEYCLKKVDASAVISPMNFKSQNYAKMLMKAKETCSSLKHIIIYSEDTANGTRRLADVEAIPNKAEVQAIAAMQNDISPLDGCNIQFTSGTTGNPKATLLSHRSFVNNSKYATERSGLMDGEHKICLNVPLFHAFAMVMGQLVNLHFGGTIVLESRSFNPKAAIETIIREKCTVCFGTPTMWINLLATRLSMSAPIETLQYGVTGGSPASPELLKSIRTELRIGRLQNIYGLTETTAIAFQSLPGEPTVISDHTVGHLADNIEVKVVDPNGFTVPISAPGELWIRGYSIMMKYWGDEENTKKTITQDGWLKTGDQFLLRSDGYGQVVGRLKDMIIRGGENIFPKEIEHYLESHSNVLEAVVFGVNDNVYGEEMCACIRLSEGVKLTKSEVHQFCKTNMAHFKIPRYIEFVDDFPRTTSGKIQKFKMRRELESRSAIPTTSHE